MKWGFDLQVALQEIFNAHVAVGSTVPFWALPPDVGFTATVALGPDRML